MSPLDPEIPPTGEEIHLPGPTILPLLTAAGITLAVIGITLSKILLVGGVILTAAEDDLAVLAPLLAAGD